MGMHVLYILALMVIDVHNHVLPGEVIELLDGEPGYGVTVTDGVVQSGRHASHELFASMHDPAAKLEELRGRGIDAAIVSLAPRLFSYELSLALGEAMAEASNRGLSEFCAASPDRLHWLAQVPLQDPGRAATVLAEARAAGAAGVAIGSWTGAKRLDERIFDVFWDEVEATGSSVFIHNAYNSSVPSLREYYLGNVIGNLLETTICAERLVAAGTFERHPGLQIVLGHAGGFFPWQAGRLRHAGTVRAELSDSPKDPWAAVGNLLFDTITHDVEALAYLVSRVGAENVVLGTDLPYDMSSPDPIGSLNAAVDPGTAALIAERNPARIFGLPATAA
jgi:aminocarboxymuconate-semialdehyde decarboxylase